VVELKDLIAVPNIAERLRRLTKTDKVLGPRKDSWCEFHEAFGHHINNCLSLGYQLDELVKSGFLKDYLAEPTTTVALPGPAEDQAHEMPVHGDPWDSNLVFRRADLRDVVPHDNDSL